MHNSCFGKTMDAQTMKPMLKRLYNAQAMIKCARAISPNFLEYDYGPRISALAFPFDGETCFFIYL